MNSIFLYVSIMSTAFAVFTIKNRKDYKFKKFLTYLIPEILMIIGFFILAIKN